MKSYKNIQLNELSFKDQKRINGGDNPLVEFIKRLFGDKRPEPHPCGGIGSQSRVK